MVQYEYRKEEEDISITYCTLFLGPHNSCFNIDNPPSKQVC